MADMYGVDRDCGNGLISVTFISPNLDIRGTCRLLIMNHDRIIAGSSWGDEALSHASPLDLRKGSPTITYRLLRGLQ